MGAGEVPLRVVDRRRAREAAVRPLLHQAPVGRLRLHDSPRHGESDRLRQGGEMTAPAPPATVADSGEETLTVARNVSTRYLAIAVEALLGLVVLPFNVSHLGTSAYGLWVLTGSITAYFSVLDLGYGGALVKFVAQYRARREYGPLNEILSTLFVVFGAFGAFTYVVAIMIAVCLGRFFHVSPDQLHIGRIVLLIISL